MHLMTAMPAGKVLYFTVERNPYTNILKSHKIFWYYHKKLLIWIYENDSVTNTFRHQTPLAAE